MTYEFLVCLNLKQTPYTMKFMSFFRTNRSFGKQNVIDNAVRKEIDSYVRNTFYSNYIVLESSGRLEKFIDDSEDMYIETIQIQKDQNYNASAYFDEEDKMANYVNEAFSVVFQDISRKLDINDYQ